MKDLFNNPPQETQIAIDKFNESLQSYGDCVELQKELNAIGYDLDFGLDAEPYNLKKL